MLTYRARLPSDQLATRDNETLDIKQEDIIAVTRKISHPKESIGTKVTSLSLSDTMASSELTGSETDSAVTTIVSTPSNLPNSASESKEKLA